jgi:uncharacterized protein (TIGR03067 family)
MNKLWPPLFLILSFAGLAILVLFAIAKRSRVDQRQQVSTYQDSIGQEKELLKGSWNGLWGEFEGKKVEFEKEKKLIYTFNENGLVIKATDPKGEVLQEESYEIDPMREPKIIDMSVTAYASSTFKGKTKTRTVKEKVQGIYKLEANKLIIAQGPPGRQIRPAEFETKPGSPTMIFVFERLSP